MLFTKSILRERSEEDGLRISVMSRHTLNDGITPDERIIPSSFDEHLQILAPPPRLIGDYYKRGLSWQDYERRYKEYLKNPEVIDIVKILANNSIKNDITLLCIEDTAEKCHRRLLAEECQNYEPQLKVEHK